MGSTSGGQAHLEADFSLLDLLPIAATVHDRAGRLVHLNTAARELWRDGDLIGRSIFECVPEPNRAVAFDAIERALAARRPTELALVVEDRDSRKRVSATVNVLPLCGSGGVAGFIALAYRGAGVATVMRDSLLQIDLTARQSEVLRALSRGKSTTEIAAELGLSVSTVRNHVQALLDQLGGGSRLEAVAVGARRGLTAQVPLSADDIRAAPTGDDGDAGG